MSGVQRLATPGNSIPRAGRVARQMRRFRPQLSQPSFGRYQPLAQRCLLDPEIFSRSSSGRQLKINLPGARPCGLDLDLARRSPSLRLADPDTGPLDVGLKLGVSALGRRQCGAAGWEGSGKPGPSKMGHVLTNAVMTIRPLGLRSQAVELRPNLGGRCRHAEGCLLGLDEIGLYLG